MVTEIAYIEIDPAKAQEFEAAVEKAAPHFRSAAGCHSMQLIRVEEDPACYRLCVDWESVAHHMVMFRDSDGFQQWRNLVGPFFVRAPEVEHWHRVRSFF